MDAPIFMPNLLHLSDLHFGYDKDATARAQRTESLDLLVKEVRKLTADWKPHILVISGDLTWQGKASGYPLLAKWLEKKLLPATGLKAKDCVICPGNHDIDRNKAFSLDPTPDAKRADELLRPERLAAGFAPPFKAFVKFAEGLGIPAPVLQDKPNYLAGVRALHGLRFICANSAWFCRDSNTNRSQLWLGLPQLRSMQLMDPDEYDTAPVTVAVLHHPPEWLANADCASYENRPGAYGYLAARAHVILSGHTHGAVEASTRWHNRAWLLVGGATYSNYDYRNNFSILKIDPSDRGVIRRPWELDPRVPKWEEKEPQEYSLFIPRPRRNQAKSQANPAKYLARLQEETRSIELSQLHVAPQEVPPPAIDALFIRLTTAGPAKDGSAPGRPDPIPLEEALRNNRRLVIEGKPGCGKTTFVRWIAFLLCQPGGPPAELQWLKGFPIWVRISELDQHIANTLERPRPGDPATTVDPRWIAHFLASHKVWALDEGFFEDRLQAEDTVLLLDGLDEASNSQRRVDMVKMIREAGQYACRIVVTTRPGVHEGRATLEGFGLASIDELDDAGIDGFLLQWCRWLKRGEETATQDYYAKLRPAVDVPGIRHMARNPLMLTSLAVLHFRRRWLPEQRVKLYQQILDWLAEQAVEKHPKEYKRKDLILERFAVLALAMQLWKGGQKLAIGIDDAAALFAPKDSLVPMRRFLEQAQIDSGIVTLRGGEIAFWHRSFQEYLAARRTADLPDVKIPPLARGMLYSAEGREVLPLVAGCMAENAKERLTLLFENLTKHAVSQKLLERKAHAAGVLGNMLADVAPFEYKLSGPAAKQYGELRDAVMAIFEKGKAKDIGLKTRVAAAEALDQASQARLNTGDAAYWKKIKTDTYIIGGDSEAFQSLPRKSVRIAAFQIGRFPVTVWEYGRYLEETRSAAPPDWEDQSGHPGRPVVSVTWCEAQDYCAWAGCKLPTEEQSEVAARGAEGRIFPWGQEEPDEYRANFDSKVGAPTPVGMFPDGDTPEGVSDMAGNVWEWTRSDFDKETKCVRGASFHFEAIDLRAACRFRVAPVNGFVNLGFRCVRE